MSADAPLAETGLGPALAAARLRDEGPNELWLSQGRTLRDIALEVLREPMFGLLLGAIYLAMGDTREALILLGFVFIIMGITALQERRTGKALDVLRDLSCPLALVLRGGQAVRVPGREVVREDVLLLAEGDRMPADGVLLQAHELAPDESMLTREAGAGSARKRKRERAGAGDSTPFRSCAWPLLAATLAPRPGDGPA
jgi:Ca2+-transporting ATPase